MEIQKQEGNSRVYKRLSIYIHLSIHLSLYLSIDFCLCCSHTNFLRQVQRGTEGRLLGCATSRWVLEWHDRYCSETDSRSKVVDFTIPVFLEMLHVLVNRPLPQPDPAGFLAPFT
ncbi:hypothetical protein E2C01_075229 [Portunus trituberculatus]|uniref:Uncharacterized protein n=1 Tax=Portunus trituberculatus TaxID=210409 RepID=A0A5B7IEG8_PORTR|nr:hypothetical protein [Portunus trituberculatus]